MSLPIHLEGYDALVELEKWQSHLAAAGVRADYVLTSRQYGPNGVRPEYECYLSWWTVTGRHGLIQRAPTFAEAVWQTFQKFDKEVV